MAQVVIASEPEFMSVEDVMKSVRLSEREIYRLADEGHLTSYYYKRRRLFEPASVHALAEMIRAGMFAKAVA